MILPAQKIRYMRLVFPCVDRTVVNGMTYGVSAAGYDVRIAQDRLMWPGRFTLASTVEAFEMPNDLMGIVHDKSTWARRGIAVQNTVIEPGWWGHLTLEITNHGLGFRRIRAGDPIAQIVFHRLEAPTDRAYAGKYQGQPARPVPAMKDHMP